MPEIIKLALKFIYQSIRGVFARASEKTVAAPNPKREKYPSKLSDTSRVRDSKKDRVTLGVRVPNKSQRRFSVIFPGVLGSFERDYFSGQSWAKTFTDDRFVSEDKAERGHLLYWTDQAAGAEDLFPAVWSAIQKLPAPIKEIHNDGNFLRAVFEGEAKSINSLDPSAVRRDLSALAGSIEGLKVDPEVKRTTFNDKLPVVTWLIALVYVGVIGIIAYGIMPPVNYLDYEQGDDILLMGLMALVFALWMVLKRKGWGNPFRMSCLVSFCIGILALALYQRINYYVRGSGSQEEWIVKAVAPTFKKYSEEVTGYNLEFMAADGRTDKFPVKLSVLGGAAPIPKAKVRFNIHTDILGFHFADSMLMEAAGRTPIELVPH